MQLESPYLNQMTDLQRLLTENPEIAERAKQRVGLAEIASLLLQLRSATKLTQRQLSARSDVPASLISELENAVNDGVTLRTLIKLARGAGAKIEFKLALDDAAAGAFVACLDAGNNAATLDAVQTVQVVRQKDSLTSLAA